MNSASTNHDQPAADPGYVGNPPMSTASPLQESDYVRTWALFFICSAIGSALAGAVGGGIAGAVLGIAGITPRGDPKEFMIITTIAGFLAGLPVSYFFFRLSVSRLWKRKQHEAAQAALSAVL